MINIKTRAYGTTVWTQHTLGEFVKWQLLNSYADGTIEVIEDKLQKIGGVMGRLTEFLVSHNLMSLEDVKGIFEVAPDELESL